MLGKGFWPSAVLMMGILALVLGGCTSKYMDNEAMEEEFDNAPEWVLTGHDKAFFSAVGSARIGKSGMQFARTAAMAQARDELARRLAVKVTGLVKSVARQMGMGESEMSDQMGKQVSRQVTRETLNGSWQKEIWISPSSDLYVLVAMDSEAVKQSVRNRMRSAFEANQAQWEKFKAEEGEAGLEKEIDSLF